ncbi:hypothetical protein [Saccharopolyspora taberi]|uniref:Uncharacterized protein n=1 Tax=Saccharopolyspora taberi TaxID=60895 RepID=A0ABN3VE29_9PSEU
MSNDNDTAQRKPSHARPEGAGPDPLIDLTRDPNPGVPDHAKREED